MMMTADDWYVALFWFAVIYLGLNLGARARK